MSESPQRYSPRPSATPTSQAGSKEFDPLSSQRSVDEQQNKVMSSFGINNDGKWFCSIILCVLCVNIYIELY